MIWVSESIVRLASTPSEVTLVAPVKLTANRNDRFRGTACWDETCDHGILRNCWLLLEDATRHRFCSRDHDGVVEWRRFYDIHFENLFVCKDFQGV
jgi:hypothetical protein